MIAFHPGATPYVVGRPDPRLIQRAAGLENSARARRSQALARRTILVLRRNRTGAHFVDGGVELDVSRHPEVLILRVGHGFVEIVDVHEVRQTHLLEIVGALNRLRLLLRPRQRGQQQTGQNRDDRDNNQQLDQSKSTTEGTARFHDIKLNWVFALIFHRSCLVNRGILRPPRGPQMRYESWLLQTV